jgi:hypothetical protein
VKVNDELFDEAWSEELGKLKAKRVAIKAMINQLEEAFFIFVLCLFSYFCTILYHVIVNISYLSSTFHSVI